MTLSLLVVGFVLADSKPYKGKAQRTPNKIEAEHYDEGASGKAYHDVEEKIGADYRKANQADIGKRSDASNGHGIGWTLKREWLNYTVEVKEEGAYTIEMLVASKIRAVFFILRSKVGILPVRSAFPVTAAANSQAALS